MTAPLPGNNTAAELGLDVEGVALSLSDDVDHRTHNLRGFRLRNHREEPRRAREPIKRSILLDSY
jgi:hypothetical protein